MVDVAASFRIDERYAGHSIEMAGEIAELVSEDFEDRGVDLDSEDVLSPEKESRKNVPTAAHAYDRDICGGLHQIRRVDDVVFQIRQLADIAILPGDHRTR